MTTSFEEILVTPLGAAQARVSLKARMDGATDVSSWVKMDAGLVQAQAFGPVDAATINIQRATIDPTSPLTNPAVVATATGNASTVGVAASFDNAGPAWFRFQNATTFGPANDVNNRTLNHLQAAINGWQAQYNYVAPGTPPQPLVVATRPTITTLLLTAATPGTAGNAITTTETGANLAFGAGTLAGGVNAVAALALLTYAGQPANNDTVTLGTVTYTYKTVLTGAANEIFIGATAALSRDNLVAAITLAAGTKSTGTLTTTANLTAGDTVRIGQKIYTLVAALSSPAVPYQVLVGAGVQNTVDNLVAAIMSTAGAGTTYSNNTPPNGEVTAARSTNDMVVTAVVAGIAGNAIPTTETSAQASWGGLSLSGATGIGVQYGLGTVVHPTATAAPTAGNMTATALTAGVAGNAIATTKVGANLSWAGATLATGAEAIAATQTLTVSGAISDAETVTVNGTVYTLKTTLTPTVGQVQIGTTKINVTLTGERQTNV